MSLHILILPGIAFLVSQTSKIVLRKEKNKFTFNELFAYSGMPSTHASIVASLATIIGLEEGIDSALFAISVVLAAVVIRDAIGLRNYLGQHSEVLNLLIKDLDDDYLIDKSYPRLLEKVGHTPMQVVIGSAIGIAVSLAGFLIVR